MTSRDHPRFPGRLLLGLCLVATVLLGGCGGASLAPVTGRVTCGGKPVTQGRIMFYPEAGRMAMAEIGPDGTYTLTTFQPKDGALIGTHRVAIHATRVGPGSLAAPQTLDEELALARKGTPGGKVLVAGKVEWLVPEKYAQPATSGLTKTVRRGPNTIDFDLPAGP